MEIERKLKMAKQLAEKDMLEELTGAGEQNGKASGNDQDKEEGKD